jgi:SAM-dependent methyltransferase
VDQPEPSPRLRGLYALACPVTVPRLSLKKSADLEVDFDSTTEDIVQDPLTEVPDYLERNREVWSRWAAASAATGAKMWGADELRWGLWNAPESRLRLLQDLQPGADVIELGCGTAAVCGWLKRAGMHSVGVDFCPAQLRTAERFQQEFGTSFPLISANAEAVPFDDNCFDAVISEYGSSVWCNPSRWLPEAHRLLRPGGQLIFFTNAAMLLACTPADGVPGEKLARDYFSSPRVEFGDDTGVEFHLTHGEWVRRLRASGFVVENLIEPRPPQGAKPRYEFVALEWARRWPSEEIWVARKIATETPNAGLDSHARSQALMSPD